MPRFLMDSGGDKTDYAYFTVVSGEGERGYRNRNFVILALQLICSFASVQPPPKYPFYVISHNLGPQSRSLIEQAGAQVIESTTDYTPYYHPVYDDAQYFTQKRSDGAATYQKFELWRQTDFKRIFYVDADSFFRENVDKLLETAKEEFLADREVMDRSFNGQKYAGIHSSAMLLTPSEEFYGILLDAAKNNKYQPYTNGEQDVIESVLNVKETDRYFFGDEEWNRRPKIDHPPHHNAHRIVVNLTYPEGSKAATFCPNFFSKLHAAGAPSPSGSYGPEVKYGGESQSEAPKPPAEDEAKTKQEPADPPRDRPLSTHVERQAAHNAESGKQRLTTFEIYKQRIAEMRAEKEERDRRERERAKGPTQLPSTPAPQTTQSQGQTIVMAKPVPVPVRVQPLSQPQVRGGRQPTPRPIPRGTERLEPLPQVSQSAPVEEKKKEEEKREDPPSPSPSPSPAPVTAEKKEEDGKTADGGKLKPPKVVGPGGMDCGLGASKPNQGHDPCDI